MAGPIPPIVSTDASTTRAKQSTPGKRSDSAALFSRLFDSSSGSSQTDATAATPSEGSPSDGIRRGEDENGRTVILGTSGDDEITIRPSSNGVTVEDGKNTIELTSREASGLIVHGLEGDDTLKTEGNVYSSLQLEGGEGNDELIGGNTSDVLIGGAGVDTLRGGMGQDQLWGGADKDTLYGGEGRDTLRGLGGDDELYGGADRDLLSGGHGNDTLHGEGGTDTLFGGVGSDALHGGADDDALFAGPTGDQNTLDGGEGQDKAYAGRGDTVESTVERTIAFDTDWNGSAGEAAARVDRDGSPGALVYASTEATEVQKDVMQDYLDNLGSMPTGELLLNRLSETDGRLLWEPRPGRVNGEFVQSPPSSHNPNLPEMPEGVGLSATLKMDPSRQSHLGGPEALPNEITVGHELRHFLDDQTQSDPRGFLGTPTDPTGRGATHYRELSTVGLPYDTDGDGTLEHDGHPMTENALRSEFFADSLNPQMLRTSYGSADRAIYGELGIDPVAPYRNAPSGDEGQGGQS